MAAFIILDVLLVKILEVLSAIRSLIASLSLDHN